MAPDPGPVPPGDTGPPGGAVTPRAPGPAMTAQWFTVRAAPAPGREHSTVVIRLGGDLDASARAALADLLGSMLVMRPDRLVIDLARVDFMDAGAAAVVLGAARQILPPGARPVIRAPSRIVRRLLAVTGWDRDCIMDPPPGGIMDRPSGEQ